MIERLAVILAGKSHMFLTEILDSHYKYELSQDHHGDWVAHFKDDSNELVIVNFEYWGGPELYIVEFKRKGEYKMTNDSPEDRNQGVKIMSTVIKIIKDFVQQTKDSDKPPKFMAYSVQKDEKSRSSLYSKLLTKVGSATGYHEVKDVETIDHPVLPAWWKNKIKMFGGAHDFVLLAKE